MPDNFKQKRSSEIIQTTHTFIVEHYPSSNNEDQCCCRICLEEMKQEEIHSYCLCKGSSSLVHQKCLLEWLKRTARQKESQTLFYCYCDLCKEKIRIHAEVQYSLLNCTQLIKQLKKSAFQNQIMCTVCAIFLLLTLFLALGLTLTFKNQLLQANLMKMTFFSAALLICTVLLVIVIVVYFGYFLIQIKVRFTEIQKKRHEKFSQIISNSHSNLVNLNNTLGCRTLKVKALLQEQENTSNVEVSEKKKQDSELQITNNQYQDYYEQN